MQNKKAQFCSPVYQLKMSLGGRRRWIPCSPWGACSLQIRSAQHLAKSADKLFRSKVSHNKHRGGWIVHRCRDPVIVAPSSRVRRCPGEPVKESHLCEGRKIAPAHRGNMVFFEFHFNSSQALSVPASGIWFPTFATSFSSSSNDKGESSSVDKHLIVFGMLYSIELLDLAHLFKMRVARLFFPQKPLCSEIFSYCFIDSKIWVYLESGVWISVCNEAGTEKVAVGVPYKTEETAVGAYNCKLGFIPQVDTPNLFQFPLDLVGNSSLTTSNAEKRRTVHICDRNTTCF